MWSFQSVLSKLDIRILQTQAAQAKQAVRDYSVQYGVEHICTIEDAMALSDAIALKQGCEVTRDRFAPYFLAVSPRLQTTRFKQYPAEFSYARAANDNSRRNGYINHSFLKAMQEHPRSSANYIHLSSRAHMLESQYIVLEAISVAFAGDAIDQADRYFQAVAHVSHWSGWGWKTLWSLKAG